jgi:PAS domain S-box-containing protein
MPKKPTRGDVEKKVAQLQEQIRKLKLTKQKLKESENRYRALFKAAAEGILVADIGTKEFRYANPALCKMLGYTEKELQGMRVAAVHPRRALKRVRAEFEAQARGEKTLAQNIPCLRKDGKTVYADINTTRAVIDGRACNVGFFTDVTERNRTMEALKEKQATLNVKSTELREVNRALRALLKQREGDQAELEERMVANVKELVLPFVRKLKKRRLDANSMAYLSVLESNLNSIISPFVHSLSSRFSNLTPKEIQIANLIKEGKTTRELADFFSCSNRTIESHRQNIRTKVGISNKKVNLRSYLMSL